MNYILDTNVISELVSGSPNQDVLDWVRSKDPNNIYLSVVTIGEIKRGVEKLAPSKRKTELDTWLNNDLLVRFSKNMLNVDVETMLEWGTILAELEKIGAPMNAMDALFAASAKRHKFTLVTRNVAHFVKVELSIENPWEP